MSAESEFAFELAGYMRGVPRVITKRFFGGTSFSSDGVFFAFLLDGTLYMRMDEASRAKAVALGAKPFIYTSKTRQIQVSSYYEATGEVLEDPDLLNEWAMRSLKAAIEHQATKKKRSPRADPNGKGRKRNRTPRRG
jgi:TfoX/Sxy family transcriptional regulator of competence genes